jgi:hypothetical protein
VTKEIAHNRQHGLDFPDISSCRREIERNFSGMRLELVHDIGTPTEYGMKHVYFAWKKRAHPVTTVRKPRLLLPHQGFPSIPGLCRVSVLRNPRRALRTAIFGNYDLLKNIPEQPGVDLICFTDDPRLKHPNCRVRYVQPKAHPRISAKYYKILSHVVPSEYDEVLWIDGSFEVQDPSFAGETFEYLEYAGIALFLHPERGCIYDEAKVSQSMAKYREEKHKGASRALPAKRVPANAGLFAGGIVACVRCGTRGIR